MKVDRLLTVPVAIAIKAAFGRAWELYKMHPFFFAMYMLLILSIQGMVVIYAQEYMIVYSTLLAPPFYAGFYLVANKLSRGESVVYPDFFAGFRFWIPSVIISLFSQVLIALGLVALIVPGIYLGVGYLFAIQMGIFGGMDPWSAMEWSRKLITRDWWRFFGLLLVVVVLNVLGLLLVGVGLLFTIPFTFLVLYVIFEDLTREVFSEEEASATPE
ncbi:MAG: hypothetical protein NBV57_01115 [Algoriphagus sp.]|nr:hypothetical protein [Algoriphagus sp.]